MFLMFDHKVVKNEVKSGCALFLNELNTGVCCLPKQLYLFNCVMKNIICVLFLQLAKSQVVSPPISPITVESEVDNQDRRRVLQVS